MLNQASIREEKFLKNALKTFDILESEKTNYLLNLRAEELTIEDFINITKNVRKNKKLIMTLLIK